MPKANLARLGESGKVRFLRLGGKAMESLAIGLALITSQTAMAAGENKPLAVVELFEDDAEGLLKKLTNPTGDPGEGHAEKNEVFSGKQAIKIIPMQRYEPHIAGWKHRIVEKPKAGEYRYLRFAWKADGCDGIMLQMHDEKDWYIRYTSGQNARGWETKFVSNKAPGEWVVVTRDLFSDFGERTIEGIALTAFGGKAAYFDHIYFGRTIEDLDRVDATGATAGKPKALSEGDLASLWSDLGGANAPKAYSALWRLRASPAESVPFLKMKLAQSDKGPDTTQIKMWIRDLDADRFVIRAEATRKLTEHLDIAASYLEDALRQKPTSEMRERIEKLLELHKADARGEMIFKAVRILEYIDKPEARKCLENLSKGPEQARATIAAREALKRLSSE
jgi:hypothetical protein